MPTHLENSQVIIQANNLSAGYGQSPLWEHATFSIHKGEFVGLLGPNGAGKTTLFRLLLGLVSALGGDVRIFNEAPRRGNQRIGYVPQRRPVGSHMKIEAVELVRLGVGGTKWGFGLPVEVRHEQVQALKALAMVDAKNLAYRSLGELSGGELQRVFLAQALVGKPDILLLDEPLANLDMRREANLVQVVSDVVRSQGVTVLLIAHDINPLLPKVDRILYVANGKVVMGKPDEIITTASLSALYGTSVEVLRDSRGRVAVIGGEEVTHQHYHS